jgi:hypothetical protein
MQREQTNGNPSLCRHFATLRLACYLHVAAT